MLGDQCRRRMRQPVGQGDLFVAGSLEHRDEHHVDVADILDVMPEVFLDVTDVSGIEIHRHRIRAGIEHRHLCFALDIILPFVGVRMPVHLANAARTNRHQRGRNPG